MGRTSEEVGLAWKGTPPPTPGKARCPRAWRNYGGEREREWGRGVWKGGGIIHIITLISISLITFITLIHIIYHTFPVTFFNILSLSSCNSFPDDDGQRGHENEDRPNTSNTSCPCRIISFTSSLCPSYASACHGTAPSGFYS